MLRMKSSRLTVAVLLAAAVILVAGGAAIASNMGFKMNKSFRFPVTGCVNCGSNWTSIPPNNPYTNVDGLCLQLGLTRTGALRATGTFLSSNDGVPVSTGSFTQFSCGTAGAQGVAAALISGKGLNIRQPNVASAPASLIIVGSHNPALSMTILDAVAGGNGQGGNLWFSIPYHTTAATFADVCSQVGMTSTGALRGTVRRLDLGDGTPAQQQFRQASCGTPTAVTLTPVLGEHIELREPNGPKSFIPAHF